MVWFILTYLDIADLDSVLAAQVASPGSQITIQVVALALEKAEEQAKDSDQTLNEFLENRTVADIVDQFTQEENCEWLTGNDFFRGNNGYFTVVREVSEGSHDVNMADTVSSDVSMTDADVTMAQGDAQDPAATLDESGATIQSATSQETAGLSSSSASAPRTVLEQRPLQAFFLLLRISSQMSTTRHRARFRPLSRTSLSRSRIKKRHSLRCGSTQQTSTTMNCGLIKSVPGRRVTVQVREFIS